MRMTVVGALLVVGLTAAVVAVRPEGPEAFGERMEPYPPNASESRYIAFSTTVEDEYEQLTVIDPAKQVILVYHVELSSGNVELCCVRNIESDLQLDYYNGKSPFPPEIRSQLGLR